MRIAQRIAVHTVLGVLGASTAVAGALVHGAWFPGGLLLALAGSTALFYGGSKLTRNRLGAAVPAGVWLVAVMFLTGARPEGDYLVPGTIPAYAYLLVGSLAGVMCATLPQLPPRDANPTGTEE